MSFDSLDALPMVVSHLEPLADLHANVDTNSVAQQHVQYEGVPPTLDKVWLKNKHKTHASRETIYEADSVFQIPNKVTVLYQ